MLLEYYNLLDLDPGASGDEIKKAYRLKAKLYHPDANNAPEAHFQFIRIKEAFDILLKIKRLENIRKYHHTASYHPHDPYFQSARHYHAQHNTGRSKHDSMENNDLNDFMAGKIGRTIYLTVHVVFIFTGLIIFAGPVYTMITRGFDPYITRVDSIFAMVIVMVFGIIMMVKISGSFIRFFRKNS